MEGALAFAKASECCATSLRTSSSLFVPKAVASSRYSGAAACRPSRLQIPHHPRPSGSIGRGSILLVLNSLGVTCRAAVALGRSPEH